MKAFWKVLGITALAAAVPVRFKKDEETGKKTYQSLLLSVDVGPGEDDIHTDIGINLGEGVLTQAIGILVNAKKESKLFTDDPQEAVLFADGDPEAAVVSTGYLEEEEPAELDPAAEEPAGTEATEEDFDPDL